MHTYEEKWHFILKIIIRENIVKINRGAFKRQSDIGRLVFVIKLKLIGKLTSGASVFFLANFTRTKNIKLGFLTPPYQKSRDGKEQSPVYK